MAAFEEVQHGLPEAAQAPQPPADQLLDLVMLSLRTADGLDLAAVAMQHGHDAAHRIRAALQPHLASCLVSVVEQQQQQQQQQQQPSVQSHSRWETSDGVRLQPCLRLTDPAGFLLSNGIISDVFAGLTLD